jgi:tetratricopeptide (TPR) repeat protein
MSKSVFISSTSLDLKEHRSLVDAAIRRLDQRPVNMDFFGSQPGGAAGVSLREVAKSDIYIGIIAWRYGYIPPGMSKSVTEMEYDEAVRLHKPRLLYIIKPDYDFAWQGKDEPQNQETDAAKECLAAFKAHIEKSEVRSHFTTPDNLASQVTADLTKLLNNQGRARLITRAMASALLLLVLFAAIVLIDPGVRSGVIDLVGLASPTPTPARLPATGFNVIVAGFGYARPDGVIEAAALADDMSEIVAAELSQIQEIDITLGGTSPGVGRILGQTAAEREAQAAVIADSLNADVVIYGILQTDGIFNTYIPEFYIAAEFAALEPELVGADTLGNPLEFVGDSEEQIVAANDFQRRLAVMRHFLRGLAAFLAGSFIDARNAFDQALEVDAAGLEVLYVFAGNAAARIPDPEQALGYYADALRLRPNYARALVGRGSALYGLALENAGDNPPPFDPSLRLVDDLRCAAVDEPTPRLPQVLAQLALRCQQEAANSPDQPGTADIDVKTAFGSAQAGIWLSVNGYGDYWAEAETQLNEVIRLYNAAPEARQVRIRALAAQANALLGLRLLALDGESAQSVCEALDYYRAAVTLLEEDVNRQYNQRWIDTFGRQMSALDAWLTSNREVCASAQATPTTDSTP